MKQRHHWCFWVLAFLLACAGCVHLPTGSTASKAITAASRIGDLAEPLIGVSGPASAEESAALRAALQDYAKVRAANPDQFAPLESFLKAYPNSPYRASLQLNLGLLYRQSGYCGRSLTALRDAWSLLRAETDAKTKAVGDRALGELTVTLCYLGRLEELEPLLQEVKSRKLTGSATEWVATSIEGLYTMKTNPQRSFRCGPLALYRLCGRFPFGSAQDAKKAKDLLEQCNSTTRGTSLAQMLDLSKRCKLGYRMAFRSPGAKVIPNAVMHWKAGHFSALLDEVEGRLLVEDSTNMFTPLRATVACLDEEASGYFLIPEGPLPGGWRDVSKAEGERVWGRGITTGGQEGSLAPDDVKASPCHCKCPMTTWSVHAMLVSLSLEDTPVGLSPAQFAVPFSVHYAHREVSQPATFTYTNFGPKWTCNWLSIVRDKITTTGQAELYGRSGGLEKFSFPAGSLSSSAGIHSHSVLKKSGSTFIREMADGSSETFGQVLGDQYFLTQMSDPSGNKVNINYDSQMRIVSVVDAAGRTMSLSYDLAQDPLKVTKVTDPFGRSAQFSYSSDGHLASVTDVLGITSSYQYGASDFISQLTTPYGVTTFTYGDRSTDSTMGTARFLTATDSTGHTSRVEYRDLAPGAPDSDPLGVPYDRTFPNTSLNGYLNYRTTYSWSPEQLEGGIDYTKATQYHFLHNILGQTARTLESVKKPLENRIWFRYQDQERLNPGFALPAAYEIGTNLVAVKGQIMSDGTTQRTRYIYNDKGNVTQMIDPVGRVFDYAYSPNQIDLTSVTTGGQVLMSASYDANHNIVSLIDSAGGVSTFSYDARGLIQTATNPLGETTTYGYTASGDLQSINEPLSKVTTFAYDSAGRLASATDSEGYTVTANYDSADRPIGVTFPDGTTESISYNLLDVASTTDRLGRETLMTHDALQRLRTVTDANGGVTGLDYQSNDDSPSSLTDPGGHQTSFQYDLQDRLIAKLYPNGASQTIAYESASGRTQRITDALGHSKSFSYNLDNTLNTIQYSGSTPLVAFTQDTFLPRPLTMTDGQGTTSFSYGPVGSPGGNKLASVTGPFGDNASFQYDAAGRAIAQTVNGQTESVAYDSLWRATETTNALDTFTMSYLGKTGQVAGVNSTTGPSMQYAYAPNAGDRRLTQIKNLGRSGSALSQFDFVHNAVGEITQLTETHGTATNSTGGDGTGGHCHKKCCHGNKCCKKHKCCKKKCCKGKGDCGDDDCDEDHSGGSALVAPWDLSLLRGLLTLALASAWAALLWQFVRTPRGRTSRLAQVTSLALVSCLTINGCIFSGGGTTSDTNVMDFSYDRLGQLIGVNVNQTATEGYTFDPSGNLTSLTVGNTTTSFSSNNLNQQTGPGTHVYDAKGQKTTLDGKTFEWDDEGRLTAIVQGTARTELAYDGMSRRTKITELTNGTITSKKLYWWLGGSIVCERDGLATGFPILKRYFGQGVLQGVTKLFYTFDHLGSVRELVDSAGVVQADYRYSTYGERTKQAGALDSDFGYAGLWHHGPSGLDLATYRAYDATNRRWISRDPLGEGVDYNLYRYCGNDPINCVDPLGLERVKLKPREIKLKDRRFCGKGDYPTSTTFAIIMVTPVLDVTVSGTKVILEDISIKSSAGGLLSGTISIDATTKRKTALLDSSGRPVMTPNGNFTSTIERNNVHVTDLVFNNSSVTQGHTNNITGGNYDVQINISVTGALTAGNGAYTGSGTGVLVGGFNTGEGTYNSPRF